VGPESVTGTRIWTGNCLRLRQRCFSAGCLACRQNVWGACAIPADGVSNNVQQIFIQDIWEPSAAHRCQRFLGCKTAKIKFEVGTAPKYPSRLGGLEIAVNDVQDGILLFLFCWVIPVGGWWWYCLLLAELDLVLAELGL
jgi:hypothetical protein